eukprot:4337497-Amphidinium_carterae.3
MVHTRVQAARMEYTAQLEDKWQRLQARTAAQVADAEARCADAERKLSNIRQQCARLQTRSDQSEEEMRRVEAAQKELTKRAQEECEYLRTVAHATPRPPAGNLRNIKEEKSSPSFGGGTSQAAGSRGPNPPRQPLYVCCGCRQDIIGEISRIWKQVLVCALSSQGPDGCRTEARSIPLESSESFRGTRDCSSRNEEPSTPKKAHSESKLGTPKRRTTGGQPSPDPNGDDGGDEGDDPMNSSWSNVGLPLPGQGGGFNFPGTGGVPINIIPL